MCGVILGPSAKIINTDCLTHRGPDEFCKISMFEYSVAYFRLAITGGDSGKPPVNSNDGEWLVFLNGEIYNFKNLINRFSLQKTLSDSKVLAEGLSKMGLNFFNYIRGMYAGIAISIPEKKIYFFRDPLGEKPLFIHLNGNEIYAASEISGIIKNSNTKFTVNPTAIASYLRFGYVEEPETIYSEIFSLDRGTVCEWDIDECRLKRKKIIDPHRYEERNWTLDAVLNNVIEEQVYYEGDAAILLSEGLDSNYLYSKSLEHRLIKLLPFTYFESIKDLNHLYRSQFTEIFRHRSIPIYVKKDSTKIGLKLSALAEKFDQPHCDTASLAYLELFKKVREKDLKVAFLGNGPDEFFWGYNFYNQQFINSDAETKKRLFWDTPASNLNILSSLEESFYTPENAQLRIPDALLFGGNLRQRMLAEISHSYLSHNGLRQADRLAMSQSIEPRTPLADSRIYSWIQNNEVIPDSTVDKIMFRRISEKSLGKKAFIRKRGFENQVLWQFKAAELFTIRTLDFTQNLPIPWKNKLKIENLDTRSKYRLYNLFLWFSKNSLV